MSFFGSLFTGSNPDLTGATKSAGGLSSYGINLGEGDLNTASQFYNDLLSGDPTKINALIAPEASRVQKQGQQQLDTAAQFHNRSGGTNAAGQTLMDSERSQVDDLINQLTGQAAGNLENIGEFGVSTGLQGAGEEGQLAQQELENQQNSIFGGLLSGGLGALLKSAASYLPFGG